MGISNINGNAYSVGALNSFATLAGVTALQQTGNSTDLSSATSATTASQGDSFQGDFSSLLKAVQSGDIGTAQSALAALQTDMNGSSATYSPSSTSSSSSASPSQTDLDTLFQAVKSGDITGAQSALTQLQSDIQATVQQASAQQATQSAQSTSGGHHHHHHGGGGGLASAVSQALQSTDSSDASGGTGSTSAA